MYLRWWNTRELIEVVYSIVGSAFSNALCNPIKVWKSWIVWELQLLKEQDEREPSSNILWIIDSGNSSDNSSCWPGLFLFEESWVHGTKGVGGISLKYKRKGQERCQSEYNSSTLRSLLSYFTFSVLINTCEVDAAFCSRVARCEARSYLPEVVLRGWTRFLCGPARNRSPGDSAPRNWFLPQPWKPQDAQRAGVVVDLDLSIFF